MDSAYLIECAGLLLRWLHLIVGIAWIGASFYFIWLDDSLKEPTDPGLIEKGVGGELWAVHGGGFYNPQKYRAAPQTLPQELHWFKWEAYSTWITGLLLVSTLYYVQAGSYMIAPDKALQNPAAAVGTGIATLVGGWLVYDVLCRLLFKRSPLLFGLVYGAFVIAMAALLDHLLAGRAAFLHIGAMLGTTMVANVFFWIIPGQKKMVDAMRRGERPDPIHGLRGKQRSVHNNYLTLPVLFAMISNHYAFTYNAPHAWLVLALIMIAAVLIRHFFNLRHKGVYVWSYPAAGAAILLATLVWIAPAPLAGTAAGKAPSLLQVRTVFDARCIACHSAHPTLVAAAPNGVRLDSDAAIRAAAPRIYQQVVQLKAMPLGNVTHISDDERDLVARWYRGGAQ
ncbi:urate hydroxylase PuuD [Paludibacterium yongneupense]|uniref:urate hydroxylase PuuD n=1 Tax=Paludibacterium yongneupense TaxID=400061 RepID=UPI000413224C|nr:urate hydroxylase PuuD [Paludibacterium yongneupense]